MNECITRGVCETFRDVRTVDMNAPFVKFPAEALLNTMNGNNGDLHNYIS